jgi:hypothetical protein
MPEIFAWARNRSKDRAECAKRQKKSRQNTLKFFIYFPIKQVLLCPEDNQNSIHDTPIDLEATEA